MITKLDVIKTIMDELGDFIQDVAHMKSALYDYGYNSDLGFAKQKLLSLRAELEDAETLVQYLLDNNID